MKNKKAKKLAGETEMRSNIVLYSKVYLSYYNSIRSRARLTTANGTFAPTRIPRQCIRTFVNQKISCAIYFLGTGSLMRSLTSPRYTKYFVKPQKFDIYTRCYKKPLYKEPTSRRLTNLSTVPFDNNDRNP